MQPINSVTFLQTAPADGPRNRRRNVNDGRWKQYVESGCDRPQTPVEQMRCREMKGQRRVHRRMVTGRLGDV